MSQLKRQLKSSYKCEEKLDQLRSNLDKFIVSQMYYYLDNTPLLKYFEDNIRENGNIITNDFTNISDDWICKS